MFRAMDGDGNVIGCNEAVCHCRYICRECGAPMYFVKGNPSIPYGKSSHFRHCKGYVCSDPWHYDKTQWHVDWQNCYPAENQEVIKEFAFKKHIADVLLEDSRTVIEFQHSKISKEEFDDRNRFYASLGYRLIWVFDLIEDYQAQKLFQYPNYVYEWDRPRANFCGFSFPENMDIFFQISSKQEEENTDDVLLRVSRVNDDFSFFSAWRKYSKDEFIGLTYNSQDRPLEYRRNIPKDVFEMFSEQLVNVMNKQRDHLYLGCTRNGVVESVPKTECRCCPYYMEKGRCLRKYLSMDLEDLAHLSEITRVCSNRVISEVRLRKIPPLIEYPKINSAKSIPELWNEYSDAGIMHLHNLEYDNCIQMCKAWFNNGMETGEFQGKLRRPGYDSFLDNKVSVYYRDKPQWVVEWWSPVG